MAIYYKAGMLIFLATVFGLYVVLVITLTWGWALLDETHGRKPGGAHSFAVVVAFRNEEQKLPQLVADLKALEYKERVSFILVDDHSADQSMRVAMDAVGRDQRFRVMRLNHLAVGKKSALEKGIESADADIIATTDADCRLPTTWLDVLNAHFEDPATRMIAGPVRLSGGFLERVQAMEFASLIGATGATIAFGKPSMCNGANLAFRRRDYLEVGGYQGNQQISSGDDQFLMKKFAARWKGCVMFSCDANSIVTAPGARSWHEFVQQRLRWAGKWKLAGDMTSLLAVAILAFHALNMLAVGAWLFGLLKNEVFVVMVASKLFAETIFLLPVCRFLGIRWSWLSFFFLQLFYSPYVIAIGFLSQIVTARWKERKVWTRIS